MTITLFDVLNYLEDMIGGKMLATARSELNVNDEKIFQGEHLAMLSEPRERMPSV